MLETLSLLAAANATSWGRRVFGLLRVASYGLVAMGVVGTCSLHAAKAEVGRNALAAGRNLLPLLDPSHDIHRLALNGASVLLSTATVAESTAQVLDRFQTHCQERRGPLASSIGVVRREKGGEGTILCLVKGERSPDSLADALRSFATSADLGRLGELRYAYARPAAQGKTMVVTAWTEGSFTLDTVFPRNGESGGTDPADYPRPPESARMLHAAIAETPYAVRVYRSAWSTSKVAQFYDAEMNARGWDIVLPEQAPEGGRAYFKGAIEIVLAIGVNDEKETIVSLAELGATRQDNPRGGSE